MDLGYAVGPCCWNMEIDELATTVFAVIAKWHHDIRQMRYHVKKDYGLERRVLCVQEEMGHVVWALWEGVL